MNNEKQIYNIKRERETDLSICIVSNNHRNYLEPCLRSIYENPSSIKLETYLVDNKSTDGSAEFVESNFPNVHVIKNEKKFGFAKNNNIAIKKSRGKYVLLLNPDTIVLNNAFERMVEFMDIHPDAGACGAKLLNPDGSLQYSCRAIPSISTLLIRRTPLRIIFPDKKISKKYLLLDWDHNYIREVDWVLGACLLVRREVIEQVGLLDEKYPLYVEDADWCYRIKKAGWKIYYLPDAKIIHHFSQFTYKKFFHKRTLIHYNGLFRFFRKHWKSLLTDSLSARRRRGWL